METKSVTKIVPAIMRCPDCRKFHVDSGEWETRPHNWHLCLHCGCKFLMTGFDHTLRGVKPTLWERFIFFWRSL